MCRRPFGQLVGERHLAAADERAAGERKSRAPDFQLRVRVMRRVSEIPAQRDAEGFVELGFLLRRQRQPFKALDQP